LFLGTASPSYKKSPGSDPSKELPSQVPYDGPVDNSFLISACAAPAVPALPAPATAAEQWLGLNRASGGILGNPFIKMG